MGLEILKPLVVAISKTLAPVIIVWIVGRRTRLEVVERITRQLSEGSSLRNRNKSPTMGAVAGDRTRREYILLV